jgi:hypothetical protein
MGLERGFRRIVVILSVGTFLLGIAVVVSLVLPQLEREAWDRALAETPKGKLLLRIHKGEIALDTLTPEQRTLVGLSPTPPPPPTPPPQTRSARAFLDAYRPKTTKQEQTREARIDAYLAETATVGLGAPRPTTPPWKLWGGGFLIVVAISLAPWLIFYVTRWVVRGFTSPH